MNFDEEKAREYLRRKYHIYGIQIVVNHYGWFEIPGLNNVPVGIRSDDRLELVTVTDRYDFGHPDFSYPGTFREKYTIRGRFKID